MNNNKKKTIIFDLDGTLYPLNSGLYENSDLRKNVLSNAVLYIQDKLNISKKEAESVLNGIIEKYNQEISIGVEQELGINRYEYFNTVWDIDPKKVITSPKGLREKLLKLKEYYDIFLLSDAPKVWIENVLNYLDIYDLFKNRIISGEGAVRKGFGNAFNEVLENYKLEPKDCIAVGDQERTDIIPAKDLGMKTIFINQSYKSKYADFSVENFGQALEVLNSF